MTTKKTYFDLVKEAIVALKDRSGSSAQAIKAYIVKTNPGLKFAQVRQAFKLMTSFLTMHP